MLFAQGLDHLNLVRDQPTVGVYKESTDDLIEGLPLRS
jgi:hypothetical protein